MTRSCARAARGQRAPGHVPKNWGDSVTLCAGIALRGLVAPLYLHGSMNGEIFEAYVEQFLVPELRPVDGRKGPDSLMSLVRDVLRHDPLSGHLFIFFSKRCDRVRIVYWDRNG